MSIPLTTQMNRGYKVPKKLDA